MDAFRAQLDELLGKDRNLLPTEKSTVPTTFSHPDVCKSFLCGFCPHDLFTNTKNDLGPCTKNHDEVFRNEFLQADRKTQIPYEREFLRVLERIVSDQDRRIKRDRERVLTQDKTVNEAVQEKVDAITEQILQLVKRAEDYAENGQTELAQTSLENIEALKREKEALAQGDPRSLGVMRQTLCETCGAILVVGDTDKRTQSHLDGKTHIGFDLIRKKIDELKKKLEQGDGRRDRDGGSSSRSGGSRDSRDSRDHRSGDRRDDREHRRDNDDRHKDRDRDDRRDRDRDRERDSRRSDRERRSGDRKDDRERRRERSASPPRSPKEAGQL